MKKLMIIMTVMLTAMKISLYVCMTVMVFFVLGCQHKNPEKKIKQNKDTIEVVKKPVILTKIESELILQNLKKEQEPTLITLEEFENFRIKSNYLEVIKKYDEKNSPLSYFNYVKNKDDLRYYDLPTEVNTRKYGSNSFVFGDLNNDGKRDCIVSAIRSDMYNEVCFFYVFINNGNSFELVDVACENDLSGYKKASWPSSFRYQKIENGMFKGITFCHYKDAHCCPSLVFKAQAKLIDSKLQFFKADFVFQDYQYFVGKLDFDLDSVLVKSNGSVSSDLRKH